MSVKIQAKLKNIKSELSPPKYFITKMSIASKEARETRYWLKLLDKSQIIKYNFNDHLNKIEHIINKIESNLQRNNYQLSDKISFTKNVFGDIIRNVNISDEDQKNIMDLKIKINDLQNEISEKSIELKKLETQLTTLES